MKIPRRAFLYFRKGYSLPRNEKVERGHMNIVTLPKTSDRREAVFEYHTSTPSQLGEYGDTLVILILSL